MNSSKDYFIKTEGVLVVISVKRSLLVLFVVNDELFLILLLLLLLILFASCTRETNVAIAENGYSTIL